MWFDWVGDDSVFFEGPLVPLPEIREKAATYIIIMVSIRCKLEPKSIIGSLRSR